MKLFDTLKKSGVKLLTRLKTLGVKLFDTFKAIGKKKLIIGLVSLLLATSGVVTTIILVNNYNNEDKTYSLFFEVNGKSYTTLTTNKGGTISLPEEPIQKGYTFGGWYLDEGTWNTPFTSISEISKDMSIYAKFDAIEYDITYENDGGTHSNPVSYTIEDSFALSVAEKDGYTFVGWYSDLAYTTKVESVSAGSTGAITLYAKFEINNYTISYGNTKDAVNNNVTSYNVNTDTITLSNLSKTGYVFEGWYNGEKKVTEIAKGSTGDITLTAKWSVIGYEITYHNVDAATNSNSATYDMEDQPLALSDASKDGYRFLGWYTDAAFANKVSEIAIGTTGDINLYAKWELIEYTATFKDGDTVVETIKFTVESESITEPAVPNHVGYTGAWESYTLGTENITVNAVYNLISYGITYNNVSGATSSNPTTYDVEDQPLTLVDASKDHYTFLGWYSDAAFTNKVTEISLGTTGDVTLYAKWQAVEYTVTFMDGTTVVETVKFTVETESITEPAVPEHVGYNGAWESYTLGTEDITVNAVYTLISYGITYNNVSGATNNNSATYDVEDQPLALSDASRDHYTFLGWYSDASFTTKVTEIAVGTTGTVELYAKWEAIEYTATFMDGTTVVGTVKFTVESESITEPAVPNHTGYTGTWESYTLGTEDITINAVYSLVTYGITYNNVSGATNSNPTTYDVEDQPLALVDASKDHYTFRGWYGDASYTTKVTEIAVGTTGTVELYAKWEAVEYTITFLYDNAIGDYAEGTVVKTTYTVEDEFEFAALVCKNVGYTFNGWFTEKNVCTGTKITGVTKGTSGNITVYAQFGLEEYDITYNNVNGATNNNPTHYNAASEDFTIYPLTKEGYTFDGWFTNEECTTPANLTITKGSNGDITLYAKWTPITYTIEYVTYGGTATGNPTTYIITDNVTFNNATLSGYVFKGWYTAAEGGSKVTGITAGTTGNIILYAHWDYVSTITFESNGGSPVNSISNVEGTTISAPVAPTKEHYTFAGWYSDAALKNAYSFTTQPAEDITLYAKWTPVVYEIEYVLNGGTNSENNVVEYTVEDKIELYAPSKVGYTFIGWFTDAEFTSSVVTELKVGTSGKITLYAHYSINKYTISFESNGGTSVSAITQNYATSVTAPEAPSKNGYTFAGWYSNTSLTSKYTFSTMPADNITLYAKWDLAIYNITYNLNGGTNHSANPVTYTITSTTIILKAPTKTGYSFAGWYTNAECTKAITEIASGSYGVVELFAKWTATEYTITYVTADGATHSNILTYTIETDLTTLADAALRGHAFGGWYIDDSYTTAVTTVAGGEIGHKTVYAKFTANTYNVWLDGNEEASCVVSFNLNGAEGTIASQTVTPTATLKYPTVPTRDGYIFAGWYENENCTGSLYNFTAVVTSDTTLYAKWVKVENATAIAINGSSNVTLNGKYEQMLMFVPLVSGNITITASGSYDTFGVLYNSEMVVLTQDDDNASDGKNFLVVYNVTAGETYYIGARAFSSTTTGTATVSISGEAIVSDGGYTVTSSKTSVTYGKSFAFNVPSTREGYKFLGYADENGVMYTDANGNSIKAWDKDEETTLYSAWGSTSYTLTLIDTEDGSEIISIKVRYGIALNLREYLPVHEGLSFSCWYDNPECSGYAYEVTTMPDGNLILYAVWDEYSLGTIKYDVDKKAISVDDEITADLFTAICFDSNKNLVPIEVIVSGTQAAGNIITVRLIARGDGDTAQTTISGIKVYSIPSLTFDKTIDYFNIKDGLTANWFGASGKDSFGNASTIKVYVDYDYEAGEYVTVTIESIDPAGNKTYGYVENVKAYGLPEITYNENKTSISVNDTLNAELFSATAKDNFGEPLTVTVSKYSGTIAAGNTVTIRISATDSKGNVTNIDVACKVYGAPIVSSATKTEIKVSDEITPELLGITAKDTYGEALDITLSVKNGTQTAGATMTITASVTDNAGNVTTKDYTIKVYGTPTITYDREGIKVTENAEINASILKATAVDSFGNSLTVKAKLSDNSTFAAGNYVMYILTATDRLGNVATIETVQIGVYDVEDITFSFVASKKNIKLSSKGEEFNAKATDSLGNLCDITIEAADGYTLAGGNTISLYLVATDIAGNRKYSSIITDKKVYDMPTVVLNQDNYTITEDTDITFLFTVYDSFGIERPAEISISDEQIAGNMIAVTVTATDDANNTITEVYQFGGMPSEKPFVELYIDGELWQNMFVDDGSNYTLPIPEDVGENGYHICWYDESGLQYTDYDGNGLKALPNHIQLHAEKYIHISSAAQLKNLSLNGKYLLMQDIDLLGAEWTPIGNNSTPFTGVFDGNGYVISNFTITTSVNSYIGLFGYNTGEIKNLGVENFTINVEITNSDYGYTGGLVGYNSGTITNCYTTGSVSANSDHSYTGGMVGYNTGIITNCYATGNVTSSANYLNVPGSVAGGLVGYNKATMKNCYATGKVTSTHGTSTTNGVACYSYAGGLVGINSSKSTIQDCYATGEVYARSSASYGGGLVGYNYATINNCYAHGKVSNAKYAGGLVGYNYSGQITNSFATGYVTNSGWVAGGLVGYNEATISNCYATGSVRASNTSVSSCCAGGLVGLNTNKITNCHATGSVTCSSSATNTNTRYAYAGGLVGDNDEGTITQCYATGKVTSSVVTSGSAFSRAGGLIGYTDRGTISNCYATGDTTANKGWAGGLVGEHYYGNITNCYATGDVTGVYAAGGLVGYQYGGIANCYATGDVTSANYAGGLVGVGTTTNSYRYSGQSFTITGSETTTYEATNTDGTETDMATLQSVTFQTTIGWSTTIWNFVEGTHPTLKNVGATN